MNYSDLVDAIQAWEENDEASFVANIPVMVRKAENRIGLAVRIPNGKRLSTGTLTANVETLDVPTGFLYQKSMMVTLPTTGERALKLKDLSYIRVAFPTAVSGFPEYYALSDDDTFVIAPPPAGAYPYTLEYGAPPDSIVDSGTSWLGDNAYNLLLDACLLEAAIFMKKPIDEIAAKKQLYDASLAEIQLLREGRAMKDVHRKPDLRIET